MVTLRVVFRAAALIALTLTSFFSLILLAPFRKLAPAWHLRCRNAVFRTWARGCARAAGMRMMMTGTPPEGSFFLVSNHVGYVDIFLIASFINASFVAKADLRGWPMLGRIFATADTIFVDRSRRKDVLRVTGLMRHSLERGLGILLFPEGTSGKGDQILPFKPPLLDFAARQELPVHHACLGYRTPDGAPPAEDVVCWWGDTPFVPHAAQLLRLPYFEATIHFGSEPLVDSDRKVLALRLREAMLESFVPVD